MFTQQLCSKQLKRFSFPFLHTDGSVVQVIPVHKDLCFMHARPVDGHVMWRIYTQGPVVLHCCFEWQVFTLYKCAGHRFWTYRDEDVFRRLYKEVMKNVFCFPFLVKNVSCKNHQSVLYRKQHDLHCYLQYSF